MMLSDIRDYVETLGIADVVYMGQMDVKQKKSFGVYHSKHKHEYRTAIGGDAFKSYETKYVTILVHWNQSLRDTEKAAAELMDALKKADKVKVNNQMIQFVQPLYDVQDVGPDETGMREMVLEVAVISKKGGK